MDIVWVVSAYVGGIFTAFLPCTLPVILGYLGILIPLKDSSVQQKVIVLTLFTLGFSFTYAVIGFSMGLIGSTLSSVFISMRDVFPYIASGLFLLFGAMMFRLVPTPTFGLHRSIAKSVSRISIFGIGILFALGWSPCIGPVLGGLLTLAANSHTAIQGSILLFVFSIGLMTPFTFLAFFQNYIIRAVSKYAYILRAIEYVFGVFFIVIGLWFMFPSLFPWIGTITTLSFPFLDSIQSKLTLPPLF